VRLCVCVHVCVRVCVCVFWCVCVCVGHTRSLSLTHTHKHTVATCPGWWCKCVYVSECAYIPQGEKQRVRVHELTRILSLGLARVCVCV